MENNYNKIKEITGILNTKFSNPLSMRDIRAVDACVNFVRGENLEFLSAVLSGVDGINNSGVVEFKARLNIIDK
jgi:hypothetical protein